MDEMLRKIDEIRDRLHVSYAAAREALERNNGNLVEAIVWLEDQERFPDNEEITSRAKEAWQDVRQDFKGVVSKTRSAKIRVLKEGRQVAEVPAAVGVIGLAGALAVPGMAVLGALGSVAAMMNQYTLDIKQGSGQGKNSGAESIDKPDNIC